jgi:outer membrane protein TolC
LVGGVDRLVDDRRFGVHEQGVSTPACSALEFDHATCAIDAAAYTKPSWVNGMAARHRSTVVTAIFGLLVVNGIGDRGLRAQQAPTPVAAAPTEAAAPFRLTLDDAKQRALGTNQLLALAGLNVQSKQFATRAMQANYFPQLLGNGIYMHFNEPQGSVLSTPGRILAPVSRPANVINEDSTFVALMAVQPLTDLLKVRQGVRLALADEQIAQAQLEKGVRELLSGVEQLYWGILAAQRIKTGTLAAIRGVEPLAKTGNLQARIALLEAQQGLGQVEAQITDLERQLRVLVDVPTCTKLELVEPPFPVSSLKCADEAVTLAIANSPEIREADQLVEKAHAATAAAKVDYIPSFAVVGGVSNQSAADYIQPSAAFVGVVGSYTFYDWGKRRHTLHERQTLIAMASLKLRQTEEDVRQKAVKAFASLGQAQEAVQAAAQMVQLRKEAAKSATDLDTKFKAGKDLMEAEVNYIKADLAYRQAYVGLMSLVGQQ